VNSRPQSIKTLKKPIFNKINQLEQGEIKACTKSAVNLMLKYVLLQSLQCIDLGTLILVQQFTSAILLLLLCSCPSSWTGERCEMRYIEPNICEYSLAPYILHPTQAYEVTIFRRVYVVCAHFLPFAVSLCFCFFKYHPYIRM